MSYALGKSRAVFSTKTFVLAVVNAMYHGLVAFAIPFSLMGFGYVDKHGRVRTKKRYCSSRFTIKCH